MELAGKYEWYELTLAPGGELASQPHDPGHQRAPDAAARLGGSGSRERQEEGQTGRTARYPADQEHIIRNVGKTEAKALLVVITS
jgi:hypothetical protein